MDYATFAKPYAKAAFNVACQNKAIEQWEKCLISLADICQNTTFREATQSPLISKDQLLAIVEEALATEKLPKNFEKFIGTISQYGRYEIMPSIVQYFQKLIALTNKVYIGRVTSAVELSIKQKEQVQQTLTKKLGGNIELNYHVDKTLLGGLYIKMDNDTVFDSSISSRLSRLEANLIR